METLGGLWDWLLGPAVEVAGVPTSRLEVIAFVSGALCVWLVAKQRILNWPIGIVNNVAFIGLFATAGLYADAGLQVVYIALAAYGWWMWVYGGERRNELPVTTTSPRQWALLGAAGTAATIGLWWLLDVHTTSDVPLPDAFTTALSLMATWGQTRKKVESWWIWITADLVYIPLYAYKGLWLTSGLYVVFLGLCIAGLRAWRRDVATTPVGHAAVQAAPATT